MIEVETKLLPLTVKTNAAPPAEAEAGKSDEIEGNGLLMTAKLAAVDVPPPGEAFTTATFTMLVVAMSDAGIDAVSCVALT
jgi:hypothetical protein